MDRYSRIGEYVLESGGYEHAFELYEDARAGYENLQQQIRVFLSQFTGDPIAEEEPFQIADLEALDRLRVKRDKAFEEFRAREKAIFDRLSAEWDEHDLGQRIRIKRPLKAEDPQ
jgi:hypothetical protein